MLLWTRIGSRYLSFGRCACCPINQPIFNELWLVQRIRYVQPIRIVTTSALPLLSIIAIPLLCASAGVSNISSGSMSSGTSGTSSLHTKSSAESLTNHRNHEGCGSHCQGAIPRNPQYMQQSQFYNSNKRSAHHYTNKGRLNDMQNRLPPIKEFRSPTKVPMASPAHIINNPRLR